MGVDGSVSSIDKEPELAKSAAVANKFINIAMGNRRTGALESKVRHMPPNAS